MKINKFFIKYLLFDLLISFFISYIFRLTDGGIERGTDSLHYVHLFLNNNYYFYDYGFIFLSKFINYFTVNPYVYLFILDFLFNFLTLLAVYLIFENYKERIKKINIIYFIFILFSFSSYYLLQINVLRQGLGLPFAVLSIHYFLINKKRISYLFLLLAISFHSSYFILVFSYFIFNLLLKRFITYNIIILMISIVFLFSLHFLPMVLDFYLIRKINTLNRETTGMVSPFVKYIYLWIWFFIIYIFNIKKTKNNGIIVKYILFYYSFLLSILPFIDITMIINRYFLVGEVLLIFILPLLFIRFEKHSRFLLLYLYNILFIFILINFPTIQNQFNFNLKGIL